MTPRQFLKIYRYDERLVNGRYYPADALAIEPGDRVGVVLLNLGGPDTIKDVQPFLYNLFMDPAIIDLPFGGILRHWLSSYISKTRSKKVGKHYEEIGGGSPINSLTREQAAALETCLNEHYGKEAGVQFRSYIAMRYWRPFTEEAVEAMKKDGINKVVLLPLYPQYSKTTSGSSLQYWYELEKAGEIPHWPTTSVFEYAAHPKFLQAFSERIDEALQRFPREVRPQVHLIFSAHGTPVREMKERRDPYCCLVHSTVDRLMALRGNDRPFHVSFQSKVGPAEWLTPATPDKLKELAEEGHTAVLVVPIAFVTDHIETAHELDIEIREEAEEFGIKHYEVTAGLNSHRLFIEALAEVTIAQLALPGGLGSVAVDKQSGGRYPLGPRDEMPRYTAKERCLRCTRCLKIAEATKWTEEATQTAAING